MKQIAQYKLLPDFSYKSGHWVIDEPSKPAHEEVLNTTRILIIEIKRDGVYLYGYDEMELRQDIVGTARSRKLRIKHNSSIRQNIKIGLNLLLQENR